MSITYSGGNAIPILTQKVSDVYTASNLIISGPCGFGGFFARTNRKDDIILSIYDGTDNTGKNIILPDFVLSKRSNDDIWTMGFYPPIECIDGIYVEVNIPVGSTISYQIYYDQG